MIKKMQLKYLTLHSKYHIILFIVMGIALSCQNKQLDSRICEFEILFDSNLDGSREIYVLDKDSKKIRQLTNSLDPEVYNRFPDWSYKGDQIVFVSNRSGNEEDLFIMDSDGQNVRQLTNTPGTYENPAWSPQGNIIVYELELNGIWSMYLINSNGNGLRKIGPPAAYHPSWSPDGKRIAFTTEENGSIIGAVMNSDGTVVQKFSKINGDVGSIKWSPDGQQFAIDVVYEGNFDIYLMNTDGSNLRRLTDHPAVDARPEWSSDGQQLVFHTTRDYGSVAGSENWDEFEIYLLSLDDLSKQRLTKNKSFDAHPDWCQKK